mmetsp:Transcript_82974/g.240026  ORF Transcript_82974/g.240026 Transcript_82974/m.240026 type:complete len:535 (+) Transcript_82974:92-1696(+)
MTHVLWIRGEALDHGVFNTSVRWTVPKVQDFLLSVRAAVSEQCVSQDTWVEVATSKCKPTLTEAEAAAYWHVFMVLQQSICGQTDPHTLDIRVIGLLLMCQVFSPHRVRTDGFAKSGGGLAGDMWPGLERAPVGAAAVSSPRASPRGTSPRVGVSAQQSSIARGRDASAAMLAFVRHNLLHFLQVACPARFTEATKMSAEDFDLLGLFLCAGTSTNQPLPRLSEAIPELLEHPMPMLEVKRMVDQILVWNEEMYSSVEQPLGGVQASGEAAMPQAVNVSGISRTTWFQRPANGDIDVLSITCCTECTIYVTGQTRFCFVAGCHDCTIVVAAVSGLCTLHNCEKISIHAAAHCFKMENSIDSSAFLYCHIPPILTGDTRGIKLAPFNVLYSQLGESLQRAQMPFETDFVDVWAHPVCCTLGAPDENLSGTSGHVGEVNQGNSTYHFVHPDTFQPVVVPETGSATLRRATQVPLCLPQVYDDALKKREEEMKAFQKLFAEITDEAKRKKAYQAIQGHFCEWLQATGKSRQLADLAK